MVHKTYRWGILGCGKIATKFSKDLKTLPNAQLYAAASRSLEKARAFACEHGFEKAYGTYEALAADPKVDIIYLATPHSLHHEQVLLCASQGKAILVEKAFTLSASLAEVMITTAHRKKVFLMEAFWTRFQPSFLKAMEILQSGELGKAWMLRSEFCFYAPYNPESRLFSPALGGGALLDIGVYPVFWAMQVFGRPSYIQATADLAPTGVDQSLAVTLKYPGGEMAQLTASFKACSDTLTEILCEKGFIRILKIDPWTVNLVKSIKDGPKEETIFHSDQGFGLFLEAEHVMECLDAGLLESPMLPHSYSLDVMKVLDEIRKQTGISFYPSEPLAHT